MHFLIRIFPVLFLLWLICYSFYSLGKKNALKGNKKKTHDNHRKKVESTVVKKEQNA